MKHIRPLTNPIMAQLEERDTLLDIIGENDLLRNLLLLIPVAFGVFYISGQIIGGKLFSGGGDIDFK